MSPIKILLVLVAVLLALVVARLLLALVATIFAALMALAALLVLAAIVYSGYVVWSSLTDESATDGDYASGTERVSTESTDTIAKLQEQYANGELSEDEFERRVEYELETQEEFGPERE